MSKLKENKAYPYYIHGHTQDGNYSETPNPNHRSKERKKEDHNFIPVIIKRNDEAVKHPDDILEKAILEGLEQHQRPKVSLFLSSIAAGLILGMVAISIGIVNEYSYELQNELTKRLIKGLIYPLGFIVCLMSGNQLFTEHTATAVYPVLDKRIKKKSLFKLLTIVLAGNFLGTFLISILLYQSLPVLEIKDGLVSTFHHFINFSPSEVLFSSVIAGWLMAQSGWLILSTPPASSQLLCIYIITFLIGFGGFHHSIAGSAEIFMGLLVEGDINSYKAAVSLLTAIIGNFIGGSVFVGILNYTHIRETQ